MAIRDFLEFGWFSDRTRDVTVARMQAARIRFPDGHVSWTVLDANHDTVEQARAWLMHLESIRMAPNTVERFAKHVAALGMFLSAHSKTFEQITIRDYDQFLAWLAQVALYHCHMRYVAGKWFLAVLVLAACSKEDAATVGSAGSGGARSAAGGGGAPMAQPECKQRSEHYALDVDFPDIEPSTTQLPQCKRTCTDDPVSTPDGYYLISSLPKGACDADSACRMGANAPCFPCGGRGRTNEYECRCIQGRWMCGVAYRAAATCNNDCDAGT